MLWWKTKRDPKVDPKSGDTFDDYVIIDVITKYYDAEHGEIPYKVTFSKAGGPNETLLITAWRFTFNKNPWRPLHHYFSRHYLRYYWFHCWLGRHFYALLEDNRSTLGYPYETHSSWYDEEGKEHIGSVQYYYRPPATRWLLFLSWYRVNSSIRRQRRLEKYWGTPEGQARLQFHLRRGLN